jgi:hypothetical protein
MTDGVTMPAAMLDLFEEPALGHVAYRAVSGHLASWPMWVSWDGTHLRTSGRTSAKKAAVLRLPGAEVAVSMVSVTGPNRWLSVTGHVVRVEPDPDFAYINSLSWRYARKAYARTDDPREIYVIELDRVAFSDHR